MSDEAKSTFERHFQTVIQGIIIILVGWFGARTMATSDIVIRMEERQESIIKSMIEVKESAAKAAIHPIDKKDFDAQEMLFEYRFNAMQHGIDQTKAIDQKRILNQWQVIRELENKVENYHSNGNNYSPSDTDGVYEVE